MGREKKAREQNEWERGLHRSLQMVTQFGVQLPRDGVMGCSWTPGNVPELERASIRIDFDSDGQGYKSVLYSRDRPDHVIAEFRWPIADLDGNAPMMLAPPDQL